MAFPYLGERETAAPTAMLAIAEKIATEISAAATAGIALRMRTAANSSARRQNGKAKATDTAGSGDERTARPPQIRNTRSIAPMSA